METAEVSGTLIVLREGRARRLPDRLTPLEAIAWIATRDARFVGGIAHHLADVTEMFRRARFADKDISLEHHGSETVKSDIASSYCTCGKPFVDRSAVRRWNALTEADQAIGRSGSDDELRWLYEDANERHCVCFEAAKDELFRAAIAGDIVAQGRLNGILEPVCRTEWLGRNYDQFRGVDLSSPGWTGLTLALADVQRLWPNGGSALPDETPKVLSSAEARPVGRPRLSEVPFQIYDERRQANMPMARSKIGEWRLCVAEAAGRGETQLAEPKTYADRHGRGDARKSTPKTIN